MDDRRRRLYLQRTRAPDDPGSVPPHVAHAPTSHTPTILPGSSNNGPRLPPRAAAAPVASTQRLGPHAANLAYLANSANGMNTWTNDILHYTPAAVPSQYSAYGLPAQATAPPFTEPLPFQGLYQPHQFQGFPTSTQAPASPINAPHGNQMRQWGSHSHVQPNVNYATHTPSYMALTAPEAASTGHHQGSVYATNPGQSPTSYQFVYATFHDSGGYPHFQYETPSSLYPPVQPRGSAHGTPRVPTTAPETASSSHHHDPIYTTAPAQNQYANSGNNGTFPYVQSQMPQPLQSQTQPSGPSFQFWSSQAPSHQRQHRKLHPQISTGPDTRNHGVTRTSTPTTPVPLRTDQGQQSSIASARRQTIIEQMLARELLVASGEQCNTDTVNTDGTASRAPNVASNANGAMRAPVGRLKRLSRDPRAQPQTTPGPVVRHAHAPGWSGDHVPTVTDQTTVKAPQKPANKPKSKPRKPTVRKARSRRKVSPPHESPPEVSPPRMSPPRVESPPPATPEPDPLVSQETVTDYEHYQIGVGLYKVMCHVNQFITGPIFAHDWLEQQWNKLSTNDVVDWHAHSTGGYIADGDASNFIVLYNATNREFSGQPNTTTVGYYHDSKDDLSWRTVSIDLRPLLAHHTSIGEVGFSRSWDKTMLPSLRRYHKAYWMAANAFPLNSLLNRALGADDGMVLPVMYSAKAIEIPSAKKIVELSEEEAEKLDEALDGVEFRGLEIENHGIDIPDQDSEAKWEEIVQEVETNNETDLFFEDRFDVSNSQWCRA